MIIKSPSIAANTPPFKKARRRRRWIEKGPVHRQLVRDVKFGRYGPGVKAADIHRDLKREYSKYNYNIICKKLKAVRLLLQNIDRCDILSNEDKAFLESCELNREPDETENANASTEVEEMKKMTTEKRKLQSEVDQRESKIKRLKTENDELRAAYNGIASKQQDQEIANHQMADERDKLQIEITQVKSERDKLQKLIDHRDMQLDVYYGVREACGSTMRQLSIAKMENEKLKMENEELKMKKEKIATERDRARNESNELKKSAAQYVSEMQEQKRTFQEVLKLRGECSCIGRL